MAMAMTMKRSIRQSVGWSVDIFMCDMSIQVPASQPMKCIFSLEFPIVSNFWILLRKWCFLILLSCLSMFVHMLSWCICLFVVVYMGSRIESLKNLSLMIVWENLCAIHEISHKNANRSIELFELEFASTLNLLNVTSFWNWRAFQEGCSTCPLENKLLTDFILVLMTSKPFSFRQIPRKQSTDGTFCVVYEVFIFIMISIFEAIFLAFLPSFLEYYLLFFLLCDVKISSQFKQKLQLLSGT